MDIKMKIAKQLVLLSDMLANDNVLEEIPFTLANTDGNALKIRWKCIKNYPLTKKYLSIII